MYSFEGLKKIAETQEPTVSTHYVKEALNLLEETVSDIDITTTFLKEKFAIHAEGDLFVLQTAVECYRTFVNCVEADVKKELFIDLLEWTEKAVVLNKATNTLVNLQLDRLKFKRIEQKALVLKGNSISFHKLGLFDYPSDMFIWVSHESEDFYMGHFWYSNFIDVKFKKSDVRALSEEEKRKENLA